MKDESKELSIKTVPVTIRVVEVGGKRMTLSVFKQIQDGYFFNKEPDGVVAYLGWIDYSNSRYILFSDNGNLLKDKYEHLGISDSVHGKFKLAIRLTELYPNSDTYKEELLNARAELDNEFDRCRSANEPYLNIMTPETQIFISI